MNFYAIIFDSSAPYYFEGSRRYVCAMKLIDKMVNPKGSTPPFLTMTIFSNDETMIPQPIRIGSIIRVHRADIKKYKDGVQINCDTTTKGAWALFDPGDSSTPIAHTGRSFTFELENKEILKAIRNFALKFFSNFDIAATISIGLPKGDCDMLCSVIARKEGQSFDKLRVCDGVKFHSIEFSKRRYHFLEPLDIIRIRGLKLEGDKLLFQDYTNMMRLPRDCKTVIKFNERIEQLKKDKEIKAIFDLYIEPPEHRVISEVEDKTLKVITLKDLFNIKLNELGGHEYRVKVFVMEIGTKNPTKWAKFEKGGSTEYGKLHLAV